MKYVINLVDYEEKYADEINEIRIDEWGRDCATDIRKKYNFEEILRIKDYWGFKHPDDYCNVCQNKPCRCTSVIFKKEL